MLFSSVQSGRATAPDCGIRHGRLSVLAHVRVTSKQDGHISNPHAFHGDHWWSVLLRFCSSQTSLVSCIHYVLDLIQYVITLQDGRSTHVVHVYSFGLHDLCLALQSFQDRRGHSERRYCLLFTVHCGTFKGASISVPWKNFAIETTLKMHDSLTSALTTELIEFSWVQTPKRCGGYHTVNHCNFGSESCSAHGTLI